MTKLYIIIYLLFISTNLRSFAETDKIKKLREVKKEEEKPWVCTYLSDENDLNSELVDLWKTSWQNYGWNTKVLTPSNAEKHYLYKRYTSQNPDVSERENLEYLKYMALSSLQKEKIGSFYTELTVFPLHPYMKLPSPPRSRFIQSYDSLFFSMMYSSKGMGWKHATDFLLKNTTEAVHSKLRNITDFTSQVIHVNLEQYKKDLITAMSKEGKIIMPLTDACELSKTHVAIRFDGDEVYVDYIKYFLNYLVNFCVLDTSQVQIPSLESHVSHIVHDFSHSTLHRTKYVGNAIQTTTEITCDGSGIGCIIKNACVNNQGGITIFGDWDHYVAAKATLKGKFKQSYKCKSCLGTIPIERAESETLDSFQVRKEIATMAVGIENTNCGHHLGDVVFPLMRLNLKFRTEEDVTSHGIGSMFLEATLLSCEKLYLPVSSEVIRYNQIPTEAPMCFKNILVGTRFENYSSGDLAINDNFSRDMKAFRSMYYKAFNIDFEHQHMDSIVIIQKRSFSVGHLMNIQNIQNILDMLEQQKYTKRYNVLVLSWEDYSVKAQLELLARTRLMISLPGAAQMNAVFLQNTAALIGFCRPNTNGTYEEGNEFSHWFDHLDYFKQFREFCSPKEMQFDGQDVIVNTDILKQYLLRMKL